MSDDRKELKEEELLELLAIAVQNSIEYFVIHESKEFMIKIPKLQQAHEQIRQIIKYYFNHLLDKYYKKPEVDDMKKYVEEKASEIFDAVKWAKPTFPAGNIGRIITQIIRDAQDKQ